MTVKKVGLKPGKRSFFTEVPASERSKLERMLNALPPGTIDEAIDDPTLPERAIDDWTYDVLLGGRVHGDHKELKSVVIYPHGKTTHFRTINVPNGAQDVHIRIDAYNKDKKTDALAVNFVYKGTEYFISTRTWEATHPLDAA